LPNSYWKRSHAFKFRRNGTKFKTIVGDIGQIAQVFDNQYSVTEKDGTNWPGIGYSIFNVMGNNIHWIDTWTSLNQSIAAI